jgi:hypothetical protein
MLLELPIMRMMIHLRNLVTKTIFSSMGVLGEGPIDDCRQVLDGGD